MDSFLHSRVKSFKYAFSGWWYVIRTQRNAWIHALASVMALLISLWIHLTARDWAIIILAISLVWTAEFLNSALEAVVDLASPKHHHLAQVGKDVGAAAVLIAAVASILIGILVLGPPLLSRLSNIWPF